MSCDNKITVRYENVIQIIEQRNGWTPEFEYIPYEDGFVTRLKDWIGGEGVKPTENIGWYVGLDGFVENIEDATVHGQKGDPFTYEDFTAEQITLLQKPALDAALIANEAAENADNAADSADSAAISANNAATNANEQAGLASIAATDATDAALDANTATGLANTATSNANTATQSAVDAADSANTAATNANTATGNVNQAIEDAEQATVLANQAALNADSKATLANTAAVNATEKATLANTAATNANTATAAANTATQAANTAATNANNSAEVARTSWQYVNYLFGYSDELGAILEYAYLNNFKAPSTPYLQKLDKHIKDLKADGLFGKIDLAYWMVGDGDLNFKTINIIDPSKFKGTLHGGLVNTLQGIDGNNVDGYVDTNFNATVGVNKYTLNNAARGAFLYKDGTGSTNSRVIDGTRSGSYNFLRTASVAGTINSTNSATSNNFMQGDGFKFIGRSINNKVQLVSNDLNVEADSLSVALLNLNQLIFGYGATLQYSDVGLSSYFLGGSLSFEETQLYRQAILNNL